MKGKSDSRLDWCKKNRKLLLSIISLSFLLIAGGVTWHYKMIFIKNGHLNYSNFAWFILIPLLALSYSYPLIPWNKKSLRQVGWLKMASLSFIWSFTTVLLPLLMYPAKNDIENKVALVSSLFIHRFFFIASLVFLFNINDYEEDKQDGIKTIAVILGPQNSLKKGKWVVLIINTATSLLLWYNFNMHHLAIIGGLFIPVMLLFLLYLRFSGQKDEAGFVIRYDGLMILKAMLLIFAVLILTS
ncbi:MAG TPA: UbiA family prenyltransferase [Chitinophagaceae bacterium]|nr:UbiA family prenyltransferase [Chitinophagaceae bacterium]